MGKLCHHPRTIPFPNIAIFFICAYIKSNMFEAWKPSVGCFLLPLGDVGQAASSWPPGVSLLPRKAFFLYILADMDLKDFDAWCRGLLAIEALAKVDDSLNGVQVGRSSGPIELVAFAVDACAESIRRAAKAGAQVLFVHHGVFWGRSARVDGGLLERMRLLLDADMALYACHLPLDAHPELGNNAVLARLIGLKDPRPFARTTGSSWDSAGSSIRHLPWTRSVGASCQTARARGASYPGARPRSRARPSCPAAQPWKPFKL